MRARFLIAPAAAALMLAGCGERAAEDTADNRQVVPGEPVTNMQAEMVPAAANAIEYAALVSASDLYEIQSSELALERSENEEVRRLAQTILADHRRSTEMLRQAAAQSQPPISFEPSLSVDQQRDMDRLRGTSGADFDREYVVQQVAAHEKAIGLVTGYLDIAENPAMSQHASSVVGPMQQHLTQARDLAKRMQEEEQRPR
jgi:putative membrane protein